jgi:hypothetical protein
MKYSTIPPKFNGNTPTYNQSLWLYVGVFLFNLGGMVEYFN